MKCSRKTCRGRRLRRRGRCKRSDWRADRGIAGDHHGRLNPDAPRPRVIVPASEAILITSQVAAGLNRQARPRSNQLALPVTAD